jgi:hypothetical protein
LFVINSDFVAKNYSGIKQANPELPILVREASGTEARAFARFGKDIDIEFDTETNTVNR